MSSRFRRTKRIAPGMRLNVGKKSASIRMGPRGAGLTLGTSGARASAGLPGTGLYVTKKLGHSGSRASSKTAKASKNGQVIAEMSLVQLVRAVGPAEKSVRFPFGWLNLLLWSLILSPFTMGLTLITAVLGGFMMWGRMRLPAYKAMRTIKSEQKRNSPDSPDRIVEAAKTAPSSWTVQREAGLYFLDLKQPNVAGPILQKALDSFPGNKTPYAIAVAKAALAADKPGHAIQVLEPYVASAEPESSPLDCYLLSVLGMAFHKQGDASRALQVVGRLPLRRRNLDQTLLLGLCIRAMAKHDLGKKADAKKDLDRVYATDPSFPPLEEARKSIDA